MSDQTQDHPGASGELPHWWSNVPKPLQHGTGEYQPPGYPTTTSQGVPTRFVPGPLNSGQLNQALDEIQGQIAGFVVEAPSDGALYGRSNAAWSQALPFTALGATVPVMDGAGAAGSAATVSRTDHIHPTDTSRAAASAIPAASSTAPQMDGSAAAGSATAYARGDHVHPTDTSRAPLASPAFTGTPAAPTASPGTNTTQLASTAFVGAAVVAAGGAAPSNANPAMDGAAAAGTSALYSRGDHVHPSDTTRAPLASPALTGNPTAPTAAPGDNDTSIATTAFVQAALRYANLANNSGFAVNQRGYASGTALAAGVYAHDRWKAGAGGCTYTFTQSGGPSTTATVTAGTLQQVVEGADLAGGTYALSWTGTAQGRIGATSYAASPVTAVMTAGTNTTLEFNAGTVGQVKFELGASPTAWVGSAVRDELANCQRFYQVGTAGLTAYNTAGSSIQVVGQLPVTMRAAATWGNFGNNMGNCTGAAVTPFGGTGSFAALATVTATGSASFWVNYTASADL